ncbi:hypothetical protein BDM02DRAFT_3265026 [Thelephora ganbajun]|uniref:Uncharacterized protein n=1 Tax=Thelephora ganbajun TaxID=370292 RepID=A0ACB6ZWD8_THEGA|nr:hypothetical protein BDM02DRAFT_3265026 [Thelephora ganbajun]
MSTTLELFWNLSSSKKKERLDAAAKLVTTLHKFQTESTPAEVSEGEETSDSTQADTLDALNARDVSYSIRRLIRGLASPRESSRLGFAVALTELLSRLETVTCGQIVKLVLDTSKTQGSMSGQEERDNLFARLFGITSIIHSGLIARNGTLPTSSTPTSSVESYELVLTTLVALGEKKSWLRESAWWALASAIETLAKSDVEWKEQGVGTAFDIIYISGSSWTPEKLALTLRLQALFPERDWNLVLSPVFKSTDILATQNLKVITKILKESRTSEEDTKSSVALGAWKPQLHFIWTILLDVLFPQGENASPKSSFQDFWSLVVDEFLFSSTSSSERKYWGFQLFQKALAKIRNSHDLPFLFTKNFMRTWINHLSKSDRYLHKAALSVASDINSCVQNHPTLGFTLILQLTGIHGSKQFDSLTKTKTVENIISSMNPDDIVNYINYLLEQVNDESMTDAKVIHSRRSWIISQLALLVRNASIPKVDTWVFTVLNWLTLNGLFVITRKDEKSDFIGLRQTPKPPFSEDLRKECRTKLLSSVAELTGQSSSVKSGTNEKASRVTAVSSHGELWILHVLDTIMKLEGMTKNAHIAFLIDDEAESGKKSIDKAQEALARLKTIDSQDQNSIRGAQLLLAGTILQQYCTAGEDGVDMVDATANGITRLFLAETSGRDKKKKKRESAITGEAQPKDGDEPPPIDMLTDTIIGFLEKGTTFLRTVANQSFSLLSARLERSTIELILTQLERRDPALEDEDEDEEMEDEGAEGEDSGSESEEDGDEDEGGEEPGPELRSKMEEALRASGIELADNREGEDDSEGELMDDDQMMAIDDQLTEVFRSRASEKKGGKDANAQREATHFKNRVLELVDIYVKKQPSSVYIPLLVPPLLQLVITASPEESQLSEKATGVLRSRIGKLKEYPDKDETIDIGFILEDLHTMARHAPSGEILTTIGQCCCYLVRVLNRISTDGTVRFVYRKSLEDFVTRKASRLNSAFFQEFIRRSPEVAWDLKQDILDLSASEKAVNAYRACQTLGLLNLLFTNIPARDDISEDLSSFIPSLLDVVVVLLTSSVANGALTAAQMKDVFKLVLTTIRQTKSFIKNDTEAGSLWKSDTWDGLLEKLTSSKKYGQATGLHAICKQVRDAIRVSEPHGAKKVKKPEETTASSEKPSK